MTKRWISIAVATLMLPLMACNQEDIATQNSPVALIVSHTQNLTKIDLAGGANCDKNAGSINLESFIKNPNAIGSNEQITRTPELNNIRITRYRVSYQRLDGGTLVPASFVRSIDIVIKPGGTSDDNLFTVFQVDALTQAPFAALVSGSGRDPETNRQVISMDVIVEVFGATLAGENVNGSTRFPFQFCNNCGGCS
jgi:hypothetical protein